MEDTKKRLNEEELQKLVEQYWSLTETLTTYEAGMKSTGFKNMSQELKQETDRQYKFMVFALNETLMVLMLHDRLSYDMYRDASGNRFVKIKTKWQMMKHMKIKEIRNKSRN